MSPLEAPTRVLILGGAGFIGSHIAAAFVRRAARVTVVDGFLPDTAAREANLAGISMQVELVRTRIEECKHLVELLRQAELVVDCMALTAHHLGMEGPLRDLELNVRSHVVLIEALRKVPGKRVIYLGSRGQYGRATVDAITEETPQVPVDTQGVHKLAAEGLFRVYANRRDFHAVSLRVGNTYGEHQRTRGRDLGLVGGFVRDLLDGKPAKIFGEPSRRKSLVYVRDVAETVVSLSARACQGFNAYNVAGREVTLGDLLDTLVAAVGSGAWAVEAFPEHVKQMDVGEARFSDEKLERALGSLAKTDLATAVTNTVAYFRKEDRELAG